MKMSADDKTRSGTGTKAPDSLRRRILRVLIYPWFIWYTCAALPRFLRRRFFAGRLWWKGLTGLLQGAIYLGVGLPATLLISAELLISLNEKVIAEQADYRLQSDFSEGLPAEPWIVPGPITPRPQAVEPGPTEAYRQYLTQLYAPVIYQKISSQPQWDIPLLMHFDGNDDPRDNVENEPKHRPHLAGLHGELTAETEDSYYLTYSLYHVKDYDHPVRELISRWTYHDNDNEGLHLRVDKASGEVVEVETWFHNRFLLFNLTGESTGTEPVHGRIYTEDGTRIIVYAQPQGHGVRLVQRVDLPSLQDRVKILRYRAGREAVRTRADASLQEDATYELEGFDRWYAQARGPFGEKGEGESIFEGVIPLGSYADGRPRLIGRFIAGRDYDINGWSRPKPMWSWDDGWDDIPIFVWHFLPSMSFESHGGTPLSHRYLYNRPCEKVFGEDAESVAQSLDLQLAMRRGDKWKPLEERGGRLGSKYYWEAAEKMLKSYVNYLFHALG